MDKKVVESPAEVGGSVEKFLKDHGIPGAELPPDMHRELVRLLSEGEADSLTDRPRAGEGNPVAECNHRLELRQGMLAFEMYLAAWIAREGICDRPRPGRRRARRKR
jgi:hypothetical protein